ncbi:MAG: 3-isopropylmalate dehydratase small subunit [Alphaproteobacteria bacterium]|nr:MAG: 3-isopropylmalate dehydratase small subunit [Alphaproteobacteria bacterium]TAF15001.1 MAG: 3-isopropylmalate dehydratase small subunit [Alphaproteobacteria bacterium]TAF42014.1 MAG: 3-isopropylmalate dehydratase small subunit [Alphaproteobacteria bacterium]TAF76622.1 MAG: 3-isopropylmalate dehydratase small subunit [Alphaproteobacteria bacterium]
MTPFITLEAIAAPLTLQNIDTDMIIPKQFLKTIKRTGLSEGLFFEMRYDVSGKKIENFILHRAPFDQAQIIVAGDNFGCGSSREHAPWALLDYGIRCIIAPTFADIFYNNCFKNGILPIALPQAHVDSLSAHAATGEKIAIDLPNQTITAGALTIRFELDMARKTCLLEGLDDIGLTEAHLDAISAFEQRQANDAPWLHTHHA